MSKARFIGGILGAALLWSGTAQATPPTSQQLCDNMRVTAWKVYRSCVESLLAKAVKGVAFDVNKSSWVCRHAYFKKWTNFQTKASLAGSTCVAANRFTSTDSGATVTDALTELVWEVKSASGVH